MLSNRCCNILLMLLKSKTSLKLKDIGKEFGISERATRYDLDSIDNFLVKYNFDVLSRKTNVGVGYEAFGENRKKLFSAILSEREGMVYDTPASRLMAILVELILSQTHITIDGEADRLMVSRSTVFKDFEKLRMLFNKEKDTLISSVSGYLLSGEEECLCIDSAKVVLSASEARDIVEIITYASGEDSLLAGSKIYKIFDGVSEESLKRSLSRIVDHRGGEVKDNTFAFCAIALCIAYNRNENNLQREFADGEVDKDIAKIANPLFGKSEFGVKFIRELLDYLDALETGGADKLAFPDIQLYAHNIINKVARLYDSDIHSARLISIVSEELVDLIFDDLRGKDKLAPTIDMDGDVHLYEAIREELLFFENIVKRQINDSDIARFYRIFKNTYHDNNGELEKKKVIVLCPFDKTYSGLVSERIKSMFDVEVFQCGGLKALSADIEKYGCDLIVSTLQVSVLDINAVKIGTNFGEEEIDKLKEFLPNREVGQNVLNSIKEVLEKYDIAEDTAMLILKDISGKLNISMDDVHSTEQEGKIIAVEVSSAIGYKDALLQAGKIMLDAGLVTSEYVGEMIVEVEKSKTHMVVMDSVVLAHSQKKEFAKKVGGVLLKLKNKVAFAGDDGTMCDIIFAISSTGVDSHYQMISEISQVLSDEDKLRVIRESQDEAEIMRLFE